MPYTERLTMCVTKEEADSANVLVLTVLPDAGTTFIAPLYDGDDKHTHYWCGWQMTPEERTKILTTLDPLIQSGALTVHEGKTKERVLTDTSLRKRLWADEVKG